METISDNSKVIKGRGELIRLPEFENCDHIIVSPGFTTIEENCFKNFKAKQIELSSTIKKIRHHAFDNCKELESIVIPKGVIKIGGSAFVGCRKLKHIQLPFGLKTIGPQAFYLTEIQKLDIPNSVTKYGGLDTHSAVRVLKIPALIIYNVYNSPIHLRLWEDLEELYISMYTDKMEGMIEDLKSKLSKTLRIYLIKDGYVFKKEDYNKEEYEIRKNEIVSIHNHAKLGNKCSGHPIKGNSILPAYKFTVH